MPLQHRRGHDGRSNLGGEKAGAHAKQNARDKKGEQAGPRQHPKCERCDEKP